MSMLLRGAPAAAALNEKTAQLVSGLREKGVVPTLAIVRLGAREDDLSYERAAVKRCAAVGIETRCVSLPENVSGEALEETLRSLSADTSVHGILLLRPLPAALDEARILRAIAPEKDVDAFHPINVGRMVTGEGALTPCTPAGIMDMLQEYGISPDGKHCVIVGRSNIVGRPMGLMLLNADATVTYCHRHTRDLASFTRQADILIVAAGSPRLIRGDMVKDGAAVIDVAMNRDPETGKFFGDVCFDEVEPKAAFITPVPGGVGPMTRARLMKNILAAAKCGAEK